MKTIQDLKKEIEKHHKEEPKEVNTLKIGVFNKWNFANIIKKWFKNTFYPDKVVLINMELNNGNYKTMLVTEKNGGFIYKGGVYILNENDKYYSISSKMYCYDYHQDISLPIKRKIPAEEIKKSIEAVNMDNVQYAVSPSVLKRFLISRASEQILAGTQISDFLKQVKMIIVFILILVVAHLLLFSYVSGIFKNMQLPF